MLDFAEMTPVRASERIDVIDILRGLALFGILAANMRGFNAPPNLYFSIGQLFPGTADRIAQALIDFFVQGKFITLFAFLFGLGFAIQMERAGERGKPVWFYPRRLLILFCIGLIHAWLIWWGDILAPYAVTGFLLWPFRKCGQKTIASCALIFFCMVFLMPVPPMIELSPEVLHAISIYRDGSYLAIMSNGFSAWRAINWPPLWLVTFILPRFLAGLWVWRTGLFNDIPGHRPAIRKLCAWGLAIGLLADSTNLAFAFRPAYEISVSALACFLACGVLLLVQRPAWKRRLTPFAAVGRMALTNYLLQSLICTSFFHWTKLYGKVGPAIGLVATVILFGIQVPVSVWWLKHYEFGPVEWLWRSLTYGTTQPMRHADRLIPASS